MVEPDKVLALQLIFEMLVKGLLERVPRTISYLTRNLALCVPDACC